MDGGVCLRECLEQKLGLTSFGPYPLMFLHVNPLQRDRKQLLPINVLDTVSALHAIRDPSKAANSSSFVRFAADPPEELFIAPIGVGY